MHGSFALGIGQCWEKCDLSIGALQQHLRDSSRSTEIGIDLKEILLVPEIDIEEVDPNVGLQQLT